MAKKAKKYDADAVREAIEYLRDAYPPGSAVRTVLRHVTGSGMTRWISVVRVLPDGDTADASYRVALALGLPVHTRSHSGVEVGGAGMDMGFHLAYSLSRVLYPDGFACIGDGPTRCPSNDHSNYFGAVERKARDILGGDDAPRRVGNGEQWAAAREQATAELGPNYGPGVHHSDGGYALSHRWL